MLFFSGFGLWRVLVRLVLIGCMLALVLGVPSVTEYLEFLGATSINLLTFILPPICYVLLIKKLPKNSKRYETSNYFIFYLSI